MSNTSKKGEWSKYWGVIDSLPTSFEIWMTVELQVQDNEGAFAWEKSTIEDIVIYENEENGEVEKAYTVRTHDEDVYKNVPMGAMRHIKVLDKITLETLVKDFSSTNLWRSVSNDEVSTVKNADWYKARDVFVQQVLRKGYCMENPTAKEKRQVFCLYCFKVQACNSTYLKQHTYACSKTPFEVAVLFKSDVDNNKGRGLNRETKRKMNSLDNYMDLEDAGSIISSSTPAQKKLKFQSPSITPTSRPSNTIAAHGYMDAPLDCIRALKADTKIAKWAYYYNISWRAFDSAEDGTNLWHEAMMEVRKSFPDTTKLTRKSLGSTFLIDQYDSTQRATRAAVDRGDYGSIGSDGWVGLKKVKQLNVMLNIDGVSYFDRNIYTGEQSITGEYQSDELMAIFLYWGPKFTFLRTDNASVMRKTWRLIRKRTNKGILTIGCCCHGFQLFFKDVLRMPLFKDVFDEIYFVVKWIYAHEGAGGLATYRRIKRDNGVTGPSLSKPASHRWGYGYDLIMTYVANKSVLMQLVGDSEFANYVNKYRGSGEDTEGGKKYSEAIKFRDIITSLDLPDKVNIFIKVLGVLKSAILSLEGQSVVLGDVYMTFIRVHKRLVSLKTDEHLTETVKDSLMDIYAKRFKFMYHPGHLIGYILHPKYARASTVPGDVCRGWLKAACDSDDERSMVISEYRKFTSSFDDPDIWNTEQVSLGQRLWWKAYGKDFGPVLTKLGKKYAQLPNTADCESNLSNQGHIVSEKRTRLTDDKQSMVTAIYSNMRALSTKKSKSFLSKHEIQVDAGMILDDGPLSVMVNSGTFIEDTECHEDFPHADLNLGTHHYNFNPDQRRIPIAAVEDTEELDSEFTGMHGDEMPSLVPDGDLLNDDNNNQLSLAPVCDHLPYDGGEDILPCPVQVPEHIEVGARICVFWDDETISEWLEGSVVRTYPHYTKACNVKINLFKTKDVGVFRCSTTNYGKDKDWVLLPPPVSSRTSPEELGSTKEVIIELSEYDSDG